MFIRPCYRKIKGKRQAYWALVESYRTERGPRQRTVAWLGRLKKSERAGIPLGYEVFAGNRNDVTTWQEIVTTMENRYGRANRIWCGDRGMMSRENIEFMESDNRRYIIGASKGTLKKFERELLDEGWQVIREGLEVKMSPSPDGGKETYILCRSSDQRSMARVGDPQRGLLSSANECHGLVGRRPLAGVYPVDRGRGRVSNP